jgi:Tat protein translocase TatB subunit
MLDIGWMEMAMIAVIALLVVGPKDLPKVIRGATEWAGKARALAREFRAGLDDIAKESELTGIKQEIEDATDAASSEFNRSMLPDEAGSEYDYSDPDSDDDATDHWAGTTNSWDFIEPGEGAKEWPKRKKSASTAPPRFSTSRPDNVRRPRRVVRR